MVLYGALKGIIQYSSRFAISYCSFLFPLSFNSVAYMERSRTLNPIMITITSFKDRSQNCGVTEYKDDMHTPVFSRSELNRIYLEERQERRIHCVNKF